jgi:ATP citrate (pro-S)-lyase
LVVIPNKELTSASVHFLDLAAKIDSTAEFECGSKWAIARSAQALGLPVLATTDGKVSIDVGPPLEFPAPFGRELSKEEAYIAEMVRISDTNQIPIPTHIYRTPKQGHPSN